MPKTTVDAYGTWALPYLKPPDVPGASRCSLEFTSKDVSSMKDFYRGKKRYRFNKWRPVSAQFPRIHSSGLIFSADQDEPFSGILSPWTIPTTGSGEIKLAFLPSVLDEYDPLTDTFEIGVGFQRYQARYWGLAEGCDFICKLTLKSGIRRTYSRLHGDVFATRSHDQSKGVIFTLTYSPDTLGIIYDEYDPANPSAVTFSELITMPNPGGEYRVLFYIYVNSPKGSAAGHTTLLSTDITKVEGLALSSTEKIWFLENPATFIPPFAPLRDTGLSMYAKPYRALIEDATIMVGSPYTPPIWMRTLDFLITGSVEPAVFTDPDGYTWLVIFNQLAASSSMEVGDSGMGYELTMPIAVAH